MINNKIVNLNDMRNKKLFGDCGAKKIKFTCPVCDYSWEEKSIFPDNNIVITERKCGRCQQIGTYLNEHNIFEDS